jgi:hypothetical protein
LALQGRRIENAGTATWTGTGTILLETGAVWNNQTGALFDARNDETFSAAGGGVFNNAGTFRKSAGTGVTLFGPGAAFNNTGSVQVNSGTLSLTGGGMNNGAASVSAGATLAFGSASYTLLSSSKVSGAGSVVFAAGSTTLGGTLAASGGVSIQSGAAVSGAATITGPVTNAGTISVGGAGVAGVLVINGSFTQTGAGVLNMKIGGGAAGSQYDQLQISSQATLGGTLNVSFFNGFTPAAGDRFTLLKYGSGGGGFAAINGLHQGGRTLTPQYDSGDLTLVALAAPEAARDEEEPRPAATADAPERPGLLYLVSLASAVSLSDGGALRFPVLPAAMEGGGAKDPSRPGPPAHRLIDAPADAVRNTDSLDALFTSVSDPRIVGRSGDADALWSGDGVGLIWSLSGAVLCMAAPESDPERRKHRQTLNSETPG